MRTSAWVPALGAAVLVAAFGGFASAADEKLFLEEIQTAQGLLKISQSEDKGTTIFKITVGGKLVVEEREYESVYVDAAQPPSPKASLVLLGLGTGGTGCPGYFKVVEVPAAGEVKVSEKFGNCSDLFTARWQNNAWRIDIPGVGGAAAQSWLYREGKLAPAGAAPAKKK